MSKQITVTDEQYEAMKQLGIIGNSGSAVEETPKEEEWEPWQPELNEKYFCIDVQGRVRSESWDESPADERTRQQGNIYRTGDQALAATQQQRITNFIRHFVLDHEEEGWEADWSNESQEKHFITYATHVTCENKWRSSYNYRLRSPNEIYMSQPCAHKLVDWLNKKFPEGDVVL